MTMNRMGVATALLLLSGISTLAGCGSADAGTNGVNALNRVVPESAGKNCAGGGQALEVGSDDNGNDVLDDSEVKGTSYLCNGTGANAVAKPIASGDARCPAGGTSFAVAGGAEVVVCNGAAGAAGATGARGDAGAQGEQGDAGPQGLQGLQGDAGAAAPETKLGLFVPSQLVKGGVLTCASTAMTATIATCMGMKVDGVDVRLASGEANAVCGAVTGKGYSSANGAGAVTTFTTWTGTTWALTTGGSTAPMQNIDCTR